MKVPPMPVALVSASATVGYVKGSLPLGTISSTKRHRVMTPMIDRREPRSWLKRFKVVYEPQFIMPVFGLTVIAAITLWAIVYVLLDIFVGDHPNFPEQNIIEFGLTSALVWMVGWMIAGLAYATSPIKMNQSTAFATCIVSMALFAYLIAFSTHKKILQPPKTMEKKIDRTILCKTYPKARGC